MQRPVLIGQFLSAIVARLNAGRDVSPSGVGGVGEWFVTLASLLAVLAVGGLAARVASRLTKRSAPELIVLLDQSAKFYSRWPEDRLASAPPAEVMIEAARCRRIIDLLESRSGPAIVVEPATTGPVDGLRAWVALLHRRIAEQRAVPSGSAYA
ncbi:hypothetical protein TUM20985_40510 [Mycobacterium antarcticum]|nr:hypothetical protein TUM20985_40510 [Mycolicibacterium sp. TUM20985]GLP76669.1 hypothetical protein TUM20983_37790 [Mycolicibacterium sp. TUM20983]GLP82885.1 hypothetical protein TUM20984_43050 [Mycolicibacterium sp. TUM20984]